MTNFSDTVIYTLGQLLNIVDEADKAQDELDELEEYLIEVVEKIESETLILKQQAEALATQAQTIIINVQEQTQITENNINNTQLKLNNLQQQYQENQENTKNALVLFSENIEISQAELLEVLSSSNYSFEELLDKTQIAEVELESALIKSDDFLTNVIVNMLKNSLQEAEHQGTDLEELIQQESIDSIQQKTNNLKLFLEEVGEKIKEKTTLFEFLKNTSENDLFNLLNEYDHDFKKLVNQLIANSKDKQIQIEERNNILLSIFKNLNETYADTKEQTAKFMALLQKLEKRMMS
ncbi:hypothetical protein C7H19_22450 [Aphanothece hegewaldii CCALA 016]|uniref:Uncharacterized protein n=1 Tax=Aphanothece hegewaldii CCALA 016 TaxID=2107694 RepID=A0A2T1LS26_9CHRO|nr:hypothetical protein [Aphanothece hegewaldii]PSF31701.1 hypothetical protein C7H19_22450 [Aphanothece hegewaldii CCALA 016]